MLKFLLLLGLALACQAYKDDTCEECFDGGTYKCGTNDTMPCVCHVNFYEAGCSRQGKFCSDSQCGKGRCVFIHGSYQCECPEGSWGRLCEHTDAEVADIVAKEKNLTMKYCGDGEECEPSYLKVVCSDEDLDLCDEKGNVRPFKKCPYPWHCFEAFRNGKCDWECERSECLYDGYECSTNHACKSTCLTQTGACDLECSLNSTIDDDLSIATTLIEFTLGVTEEFWWEHKREIIANISEPIRTPLVYSPKYNEALERSKNSLEKILSRGRRSLSKGSGVVVNLVLMDESCLQESECTTSGEVAFRVLTANAARQEKLYAQKSVVEGMNLKSENKKSGSGTLAVCLVIIAVPIVLIGYRVVSAPIWVPPKSKDEVAVIWSTDTTPHNPFIHSPNSLHEEAYSIAKIRLPIQQDYVNGRDEQGRTPLFWLIASKKSSELMLDDVDELMKAGANPNHCDDKGDTPLSIAITALRPSICVRLVHWGANPAATTLSGASCLHLAVAQDDIQCVEWLLNFDSVRNNINEVDDSDRTPLSMAAQGGLASAQIVEMLITAGADVLHQGNHYTMWRYRGRTALHWAALFNNLEVIKVLLEHRSDVNCVDTEGCAPLHLAVQRGSEAAAILLLEAHASTEIPNGLGLIPLSIAKKTGIQPLIELLSWYTDVRKEGLVIKKKGRKREKRRSDSGSSSLDSPLSPCDSLSTNSGSISSGYFFPSMPSDSSSISSGTSMVSSASGSAHSSSYLCPSLSSLSQSSYVLPKKARPWLPPIEEKPMEYLCLDSPRSESYIPPARQTEGKRRESGSGESGVLSDYPLDSVLLSPYSEPSHGSGGPESPMENLGTDYWTDQNYQPAGGFSNEEILQEFFVNWHN